MNSEILLQYSCALPLQTPVEPQLLFALPYMGGFFVSSRPPIPIAGGGARPCQQAAPWSSAHPREFVHPVCHRVDLTLLQRFLLGFGSGCVLMWGPARLRRGTFCTRPYRHQYTQSWRQGVTAIPSSLSVFLYSAFANMNPGDSDEQYSCTAPAPVHTATNTPSLGNTESLLSQVLLQYSCALPLQP